MSRRPEVGVKKLFEVFRVRIGPRRGEGRVNDGVGRAQQREQLIRGGPCPIVNRSREAVDLGASVAETFQGRVPDESG